MSDFILDESPLDSTDFLLAPTGGTLAIVGLDILVEIDAYDIPAGMAATFSFGSRAYNHPTAPDYYAPGLEQPLNFRRDIYAAMTTGGSGRVSYGEMRLINNDSALDFLRNYSIVGRLVRMLIGVAGNARDNPGEPYDTFEPLIVGRVQQTLFNNTDLTIRLRDRLEDLAGPIPANKFAGDNVLPDGLEGVEADDIKDRFKPRVFGLVLNVTPPCVNTARLIYQVNDGPLYAVLVHDNAAPLTIGTPYTDQADMEANAPAPGFYRVWAAGGYFRLGATPVGTITADAADAATTAENTAAQVALRIVTLTPPEGEGGVDSADISFDDIDALDLANGSGIGIWINNGETYAAALDQVLTSVGAWYGFDRIGIFRMQRLEHPVAPYAMTLCIASRGTPLAVGERNIVNYRFMPSNDPERGTPAWRVSLDYARNYTVQPPSATAGVVLQARKNFLALPTRTAVADNTGVRDFYPLAIEKKVSTLLLSFDDAVDEAFRVLSMFDNENDFLEIDTILSSDLIALIDIGSVVNVVLPRFQYTTGKLMRVIGMQYNAASGIATLALWG